MKKLPKKSIVVAAWLATSILVVAQGPVDPAKFDENTSGSLEQGNELRSYLAAINELRSDEVDSDRNGFISAKEAATAIEEIKGRVEEEIGEIEENLGEKTAYSVDELRVYYAGNREWPELSKDENDDNGENWTYYLRESHEDIGILDKVAKDAVPSNIAFSRNFEDDQDSWDIKAALIARRKLAEGVYFLPSITLDYSENNSPTGEGEKDSLVGRFGFEFVDSVANGDVTNFYRINLASATETDFESIQEALELQWEPVVGGTILGVPQEVFGAKIGYLLRPIIHGEMGYVFDAGAKPSLSQLEDEFFSRLGPKIKVDLWTNIKGLERFSANIAFAHYEAIGGLAESGTHLESALKYRLDAAGHAYLQLKYEKGEIPLSQDSVDKLTFGVGLKF